MKITLLLIIVLLFVTIGLAQSSKSLVQLQQQANILVKPNSNDSKYISPETEKFYFYYDKIINKSSVCFTYSQELSHSYLFSNNNDSTSSSLSINISFDYDGKVLQKTPDVFLVSIYHSAKNPAFGTNSKLTVVIDGENNIFNIDRGAKIGYPITYDSASFSLTRTDVQKIAMAKSVKFEIGNYERKVKPKWFANILKISQIDDANDN